uniref:Small ribosomal subunit protein mS35 mitochondrial conserved domain-containing protein n=1 Tax=Bionectria ochroleuca TaxID=29856 RepID=A0A8H7NFQ6_BIOOC
MASAANAARLNILSCRQVARLPRVARAQLIAAPATGFRRTFNSTAARRAEEPPAPTTDTDAAAAAAAANAVDPNFADLNAGNIEKLQGSRILDYAAKENGYLDFEEFVSTHHKVGADAPSSIPKVRAFEQTLKEIEEGPRAEKSSFWYDEDDPETNTNEHDEFDEDDITEMAHSKLEEVREMRHYQRLAIWELPLLSKLAKPFEPPTEKQVLRWRYTTYMGDTHPAEKKVVVQFAPDDLGLTPVQAEKLKKLAGPRYNPETEFVKISCESYTHPAQNKRYLSNLVDDLIAAAKDPKDTFEDIPLDTRHHKTQEKPKFPKEWLVTEDRQKFLEEDRRRVGLEEYQAIQAGELVDGKQAINNYLVKKMEDEQRKLEEVVEVPKGGAAKPSTWASKSGKARR